MPYRVQVGDELAVRLFLTPELNEDVTVRPDGRISTQLAEAVPAEGRTPEAIAVALRTGYASELRDPRITVEVKSYAPVRVYVAGEVFTPGEITTAGPPPTLLAAVARAGGVRLSGDKTGRADRAARRWRAGGCSFRFVTRMRSRAAIHRPMWCCSPTTS
ncbi:MAG: polysaccharide biosynthesis/export family protein [Rhodospirillales bacterium]